MVTCAAVSAMAGHQGHGRGPRADHHHPLVAVVEVLGPGLGVHDLALEALATGELGRVAALVAVVPGAHEQVVAGHGRELAVVALAACGCRRVQRASSVDQRAVVTCWPKRMWRSMPNSDAVSCR